jgi:hypothetical protein
MSRVVYFNVRIIDDITHFHGGMPTGVRIGALCNAVHTGCLYYCARDQVKECRAWHCRYGMLTVALWQVSRS